MIMRLWAVATPLILALAATGVSGGESGAASVAPAKGSGLVGTIPLSTFRRGAVGRLALLETGALNQTSITASDDPASTATIPIVLRNNTTQTLTDIQLTATALDQSRQPVGRATSQPALIQPAAITPGGLGIGQLDFQGNIAAVRTYDYTYTAAASRPGSDSFSGLQIRSHALTALPGPQRASQVVGDVHNPLAVPVGMINVVAVCFDARGRPSRVERSDPFVTPITLAPGDTATIETVDGVGTCGTYLVGASGVRQY